MTISSPEFAPVANGMLAALPRPEYRRLLEDLEAVPLLFGQVLYEPGEVIAQVYFPGDSLVALLTVVEGHPPLGVGLVGREGMVGIPFAQGVGVATMRALVQAPGGAMRMPAVAFRRALRDNRALEREVLRYTEALLAQLAQTAACIRFHVVEARLARWMLMTRDRTRSDRLKLTHEFLAQLLGVRRVGVTEAAFALKERGLIAYSRGSVDIVDSPGLEAASCLCYHPVEGRRAAPAPRRIKGLSGR